MSIVLKRYDVVKASTGAEWTLKVVDYADGDWVGAQDAYDAIAILEAKLRVLETQLKDLKREQK